MNNPFDELNKQMKDQQQLMTRRDYFAAMAMQSLLSVDTEALIRLLESEIGSKEIINLSVKVADALIEELRK